jgi:hypothetical protein
MKYLVCPVTTEIVITNVLGDPMRVRREVVEGNSVRIVEESNIQSWWSFLLVTAADPNFYEKIDNALEATELGIKFRSTVIEARDANAKVIKLEDEMAKRVKSAIMKRALDRNTQHNYHDWLVLVDRMSDKDPTVALASEQLS